MIHISVIIPAYNAELYIEDAIISVLNQTLSSDQIEILVINDGSTDKTCSILQKYIDQRKIVYLEHEGGINMGVSKTRMLGIRKAKGEYIAFLDADDLFKTDKLEKQLAILKGNPSVILTHSKAAFINETNQYFNNEFVLDDKDKKYRLNELESWLKYSPICNSSMLVRKDFLFNVHIEYPQAFQHEDWLLLTLLSAYGEFYYCNEALVSYRYHEKSATAGLLKNNLLIYYSRIEYLLTLYLSTPSDDISNHIVYVLKQTIIDLAKIYSGEHAESENKMNALFQGLFNVDNQVMNKIIHLQNENSILKESFFNKVVRKIKSFI